MAAYIESTAAIRVWRASDKKDVLYAPRDSVTLQAIRTQDSWSAKSFRVAPSGTETRQLDDVAAPRGIYIEADNAVTVTLNGTIIIPLILMDTVTGRKAQLLLQGFVVSAVSFNNPSLTATVTGEIVLIGDPTA